jgi:hypothetical protein
MTTRRGVTEQAAIVAIDSAALALLLPTIRGTTISPQERGGKPD